MTEPNGNNSCDFDQLRQYANDLKEVYRSEQKKRQELEILNAELREAYLDTIRRLIRAAGFKDEETGSHIVRMSRYSGLIAEKLGLDQETSASIRYAAPLHDVGKIGIPDRILMKPGPLTQEEFSVMKTHTQIGAKVLAQSRAPILRMGQQIAISHHEKFNGTGYPQGLKGKRIPLPGRITGIADVFDALTSRRPYKDAYPVEVALEIMEKERERHFDPDVLDVFFGNMDEILRIREEVGEIQTCLAGVFEFSKRDQNEGGRGVMT